MINFCQVIDMSRVSGPPTAIHSRVTRDRESFLATENK